MHPLPTTLLVVVTSLLAACSSPTPPVADANGFEATPDQVAATQERFALIEQELARGVSGPEWAREWAGTYRVGYSHTCNVRFALAPRAGLAHHIGDCFGMGTWATATVARRIPGGLRLRLDQAPAPYFSETIYLVRWGDRRFLVPEGLMPAFIQNYNEGGPHRALMANIPERCEKYHREARLDHPDTPPVLPAQFRGLLKHGP